MARLSWLALALSATGCALDDARRIVGSPDEPAYSFSTTALGDTNFACAIAGPIDTPGPMWCWGANGRGQLGNGDTASSSVPVAVASTDSFGDLALGAAFTCGFADLAGPVWCWGANGSGQLGNGDTIDSRVPVPIASDSAFNAIAAGANYACGIVGEEETPGPIWCWGANESGQLGNGTTVNSSVPVAIAAPVNLGDLTLGPRFACALADFSGPVWCWGANERGQLGDGTTESSSVPVPVSSSLAFRAVTAGPNFACGIAAGTDSAGPVWCWGANESGQLGNGDNIDRSVPVPIASSLLFREVNVGPNFACAYGGDAADVWCWGANESGQLGNGTTVNSSVPVAILSSLGFDGVAVGRNFACAYSGVPGPVWCWGGNESGQLGNGTTTGSSVPTRVATGVALTNVNAGRDFACARAGPSGPIWCWGANESGQLGDGTTVSSSVPVAISSSLEFNTHTVTRGLR